VLDGLEDPDAGFTVLDLETVYGWRDLDHELDTRTWQNVLARCYRLIELPDTLTRKEALTRGV